MSIAEEKLMESLRDFIKANVGELIPTPDESVTEVKSDLPLLLDREEMMALYKIVDPRTFKRRLDTGRIPKSTNTLGRKHLWNRDVVLNSINNG